MHSRRFGALALACGLSLATLAAFARDPLMRPLRVACGVGGSASAGIPASMTAAHLLSGFRPLLADLMWVRADSLFRRGRLFELAALFKGIAAIDPRNAAVREFAAWHLAYNVALAERDPDKRFEWFVEGMELLAAEPEDSPFRARVRAFGGRMILERGQSGIFPGFEERFRKRFGSEPVSAAVSWLEDSTARERAPAEAFAALAACLGLEAAKAEERKDPAARERARERIARLKEEALRRFPDQDWSFMDGE